MTSPHDLRSLLARARQKFLDYDMLAEESPPYEHRMLMEEIDAALEAVPAAPAPVAVAERLPGPDDCDSEGNCWLGDYDKDTGHWFWIFANPEDMGGWIRWLPHWALPLPERPR